MTISTLTMDQQACFQFKTSFFPCTILQLTRYDLDNLEQHLNNAINKAPTFFIGSPVIIDIEKIQEINAIHFVRLKQILIAGGMVPIGVRGGSQEQSEMAAKNGLPLLSPSKLSMANANDTQKKKSSEEPLHHPTKLMNSPIRSGMQVYAKGGDLIVTAAVSHGAELLADGNIHIYGPLRGRALAGVQGNINARIFCRKLEAELVSIAGYYLTKEDLQSYATQEGMMQIYLEGEQVHVATL